MEYEVISGKDGVSKQVRKGSISDLEKSHHEFPTPIFKTTVGALMIISLACIAGMILCYFIQQRSANSQSEHEIQVVLNEKVVENQQDIAPCSIVNKICTESINMDVYPNKTGAFYEIENCSYDDKDIPVRIDIFCDVVTKTKNASGNEIFEKKTGRDVIYHKFYPGVVYKIFTPIKWGTPVTVNFSKIKVHYSDGSSKNILK